MTPGEDSQAQSDRDDSDVLRRARAGDDGALETLYTSNLAPARRLATILAGTAGADDLVADSFARVLGQIAAGRGPTDNFRGYLFATIRNRYRDVVRMTAREAPASDQPWLLDAEEPPVDELVDTLDDDAAVAALVSLPESWQQVLWHIEVEGRPVPDVATLLRMTPAAVSSLAYRAREGLKTAYLSQHVEPGEVERSCQWTRKRLGPYVRDTLSPRAVARVRDHLPGCADCSAALADLERVNQKLAGLLVPILLVGGMRALGAGAGGAGGGGAPDVSSSPGRLGRELAARAAGASPSQAVATAAAAAGGAGVAARLRNLASGGGRGRSVLVITGGVAGAVTLVVIAAVLASALRSGDPATDPSKGAGSVPSAPSGAPSATPEVPATASPTPSDLPTPTSATTPATPTTPASPTTTTPTTTTPTTPTTSTAPTSPPTSPSATVPDVPVPIPVRPARPSTTRILECGTYGSVTMPDTEGVSYDLVEGDGRQGPWRVRASALDGYTIREGAPTSFRGDLGPHYPCPRLGNVAVRGAASPWDLVVPVRAAGPASFRLRAVVVFDVDVAVPPAGVAGTGWTCWGEAAGERHQIGAGTDFFLQAGTEVTCLFEYVGQRPPAVRIRTETAGTSPPGGTVRLYSEGRPRGSTGF